jgi:hypothetical protein
MTAQKTSNGGVPWAGALARQTPPWPPHCPSKNSTLKHNFCTYSATAVFTIELGWNVHTVPDARCQRCALPHPHQPERTASRPMGRSLDVPEGDFLKPDGIKSEKQSE